MAQEGSYCGDSCQVPGARCEVRGVRCEVRAWCDVRCPTFDVRLQSREVVMRRSLMFALVLVATCSHFMAAAPDAIKVDGGQISGTTAGGVRVFKGIPFAA